MSARWMLDVAGIAYASGAVLRNHASLRKHQATVFTKTSSLTALTKIGAGTTLFAWQRPSKSPPISSAEVQATHKSSSEGGQILASRTSKSAEKAAVRKEQGRDQDHHYTPSEQNSSIEAETSASLPLRQEKGQASPLPDGTLVSPSATQDYINQGPATLDGSLSSAEARREQYGSESRIPNAVAREPPRGQALPQDESEQIIGNYDRPPANNEPTLSSLPRVKIPKNAETTEGSDGSASESGLNTDVYHSPGTGDDRSNGQERFKDMRLEDSTQQQKDASGLDQLFHNPRIGRTLLGQHGGLNPYRNRQKLPPSTQWPPPDRHAKHDASNYAQKAAQLFESGAEPSVDIFSAAQSAKAGVLEGDTGKQVQSYQMRESRVPSSRFGRIWEYAGLGASMTVGAAAEGFRRMTGSQVGEQGSLVLSSANIERLVSKLSRMRGAALKIGQLLSFQDSKFLPPAIIQVLQRVQDSADFMPAWQRNRVLQQSLGTDWRDLFKDFDEHPFAAASIGQVHKATLRSNNQNVVVKIQYPGVANSIDSDLNNLSLLLHASRLLPKGLYLDKTIANARVELAWECDYEREAEAARTFEQLLADERDIYHVPKIYGEASGSQVLTMQYMKGKAVAKLQNLSQDKRDWIGTHILRLCFREITEFRYMQTDPNWTNFLYNAGTHKLELLDFGASRAYPDEFIIPYTKLLLSASNDDQQSCRDLSVQLGYLTGMESKAMVDAHIKSLTILAEPFKKDAPRVYDFRDQTITDRVRSLIPLMLRERLSPPPEETYSLHRKLSGAFLLLAKLGSRVDSRQIFESAMRKAQLA